ncbi:hypothetical protein NDI52_33625, partial [Leptolyngbya sp. PL-A3]|uniref:hypothetical protein n=1 Tax=Leptolyngbya sp. PL-A3 TaxID=2933911 RepID=UPI003299898C
TNRSVGRASRGVTIPLKMATETFFYFDLFLARRMEEGYEGMNIAGVKGLSEEAISTLIRFGAKLGNR